MLIVYKFNFELTIIGILLILRRGEEVHDVVFGKQGTAQNSHDLHDWTSKLEVVLNDSDETVCDDGNMNLDTHGIVALSPKRLNPKTTRPATCIYKGERCPWQQDRSCSCSK